MDGLILKTFVVGELLNNCYLVYSQETKEGFIIDCPRPVEEINKFIAGQNLKILFIALTHAHFDHIGGLGDLPFPFYIHRQDLSLLKNPQLNGSLFFASPVGIDRSPFVYTEDKFLRPDDFSVEILHTPGHTPGSVSLKLNDWLFSGDALFFDSVGRTDVPLAAHDTLIKSIQEKIMTLPPDTRVYPGHGPATTVGREKEHNPFLQ